MKKIIINLIFLLGILLILYPIIGKIFFQISQSTVIYKYKKQVSLMNNNEIKDKRTEYEKYNRNLLNGKITSKLNLIKEGEIIGYIEIPKINVYLTIYEGTTKEILLQGIGHIEETCLPSMESSNNSILVGHNGISNKTFFDRLDELKINDVFYIHILDDILEYKVCKIKTILPNQVDSINVLEDKNTVTLVTCVPKYINSHRLVVIGEKVKKTKEEIGALYVQEVKTDFIFMFFIVVIVLIIIKTTIIK